uniref:Uncharacterized protein n=1 Tax=Anguilla anguilla TaxID=7936 RepID=A0A0E9T686_ANGAN
MTQAKPLHQSEGSIVQKEMRDYLAAGESHLQ